MTARALSNISALGSPPHRSSATATPASGPSMPATYSRLCALPFAAGFVSRPVASSIPRRNEPAWDNALLGVSFLDLAGVAHAVSAFFGFIPVSPVPARESAR